MAEEKKQSEMCCEGICIVVKPTDKGVCINVQTDDAEKAEKLKSIVKNCCGDSESADCCK